jgi:hypothetical protein
MRIAVCNLPPDFGRVAGEPRPEEGLSWARFGDQLFLFGEGPAWEALSRRAAGSEFSIRELPGDFPRHHLDLVVQKGRLFQADHPDVPVLLDRALPGSGSRPKAAERIGQPEYPCYTLRPLGDQHTVFETRVRGAARAAEVPWVRALVDGVDREAYSADLAHLVSFPTRDSTGSQYRAAAGWAAGRLERMGYRAELRDVAVGGATSQNVVADREGHGPEPRGVVLVVAHLDSVNHRDGPNACPRSRR